MVETRRVDARASDARSSGGSAFDFQSGSPETVRGEGDESLGTLLRQLADQGAHLAEKQVELVKAELRSSVADMKQSAGAMAGAAVLGISGIGVTLMGVAFLLATAMPVWIATLIVGVATLVGAYAMFAAGQGKLQSKSMTVDRSRHTLERAPEALAGETKEDRRNG